MSIVKEFQEFAVKGNMIDMAVGIVIGGAFGKVVTSLVNDIIMPPIGVLLGGVVGVGTLVFAFGVGPLTQFFLRHLVVRLDAPVAVAVEGETR